MLLLSLAALLSSCAAEGNDKKQDLIVKTTQAVPVSHQGDKEFSFIARPFRTSELSFRVGGPIDRFDVYASTYEKAKADYITAKTTFNTASYELEDTRLIAPFNGYVGEVYIEKFQDVKATQPIISFIDIDQLKLEIYVTQDIARAAQALDTIQVRFDAQPDKVYNAKIMEISKGTTRNNLSYLLTALLPNKEGKLLAGMSGKASLNTHSVSTLSQGAAIPQTALCHRPTEGDYLWIVNSKTQQVTKRKVKKGDLLPNGYVSITEDLYPDETVANSGLRFLSDGMKISVENE